MKVELMVFLKKKKKKKIWGKWAILGPKTTYPYDSGSDPSSFQRFCRVKEVER